MDISKFFKNHKSKLGGTEILRYIGPGFLVTVSFIDPGNWASNVLAGSSYGYKLLWMVTLSTILLIILQHNVAHLSIVQDFAFLKLQQSSIENGLAKYFYRVPFLPQFQPHLRKSLVLLLVSRCYLKYQYRLEQLFLLLFLFLCFFRTVTENSKGGSLHLSVS